MSATDFGLIDSVVIDSREALVDRFRAAAAAGDVAYRVLGAGSTQDRVPAPDPSTSVIGLELSGLDSILRLDPGDFTCSVEASVTRTVLDAALDEHGLRLACARSGTTIGGCFARGDDAAPAPGRHCTRSLILGVEGVLAEGLPFKAGAPVVKSVAGFDLQRLFVGSRGRLFVATTLHLKLVPAPAAEVHFIEDDLDASRASQRFATLRRLPAPPTELWLQRKVGGSHRVSGVFAGRPQVIEQQMKSLELVATPGPADGIDTPRDSEQLRGSIATSRIATLLETAPASVPVTVGGTGQFDLWAPPSQSDILLHEIAAAGGSVEILVAAADRRGKNSGTDPESLRLQTELKRALDPHNILR